MDEKTATATLSIAADCPLGEHQLRLRARSAASPRSAPSGSASSQPLAETEPNNDFDAPQQITADHTVAGVLENEDVDYYPISAKKGERLSVEIEGMRLGSAFFDPYVAILNRERFELATSDDTALLLQDCVACIIVPEDGDLHHPGRARVAYDRQWQLPLPHSTSGTFPRPTAVFPAGGQAGQQLKFRLLGDQSGEIAQSSSSPMCLPTSSQSSRSPESGSRRPRTCCGSAPIRTSSRPNRTRTRDRPPRPNCRCRWRSMA